MSPNLLMGFRDRPELDLKGAQAAVRQAFERAYPDGKALVATLGKPAAGAGGKGWVYSTNGGAFGADYSVSGRRFLLRSRHEPVAGCGLSVDLG